MNLHDIRDLFRQVLRDEIRDAVSNAVAATPAPCPSPPGESRLLTVAEAAAFARVREDTVRSWVKGRKLLARRAGRRLLVCREDLERFLMCPESKEPVVISVEARADQIVRHVRRSKRLRCR